MFRNGMTLEEYAKAGAVDHLAHFKSMFVPYLSEILTDDDLMGLIQEAFIMGANERFLSLLENQDQLERLVELHMDRENGRTP